MLTINTHTYNTTVQFMIKTFDKLFRPRMSKPQCSHIIIEKVYEWFSLHHVRAQSHASNYNLLTRLKKQKNYGISFLWSVLTNWIHVIANFCSLSFVVFLMLFFHSKHFLQLQIEKQKKNTKTTI